MKIIRTITQKLGMEEEYFVEDIKTFISLSRFGLVIKDLKNAGKRGVEVVKIYIQPNVPVASSCEIKNDLNLESSSDFISILFAGLSEKVDTASFDYCTSIKVNDDYTAFFSKKKGIDVFSPFAVYPRLKSNPKKWNRANVLKALMNGQCNNYRCDGRYTDDYAFDDAYNYQRQEYKLTLELAEKVMQSKTGWRFSEEEENKISVNHCHFEYNSFIFDVDAENNSFEYEEDRIERQEEELNASIRQQFEENPIEETVSNSIIKCEYNKERDLRILSVDGKEVEIFTFEQRGDDCQKVREIKKKIFDTAIKNVKVISLEEINENKEISMIRKINNLKNLIKETVSSPNVEKVKVIERLILDSKSFELFQKNIGDFPISKFSNNKGGTVLNENFTGIDHTKEYNDYSAKEIKLFWNNSHSLCTEVIGEGNNVSVYVDCQGSEYPRYTGVEFQKVC